jgi:hypothetical protein
LKRRIDRSLHEHEQRFDTLISGSDNMRVIRVLWALLAGALAFSSTATSFAVTLDWVRQIGTPGIDASFSVEIDAAGNAYIGGFTEGSLSGDNAGDYDAFLAKYDMSGNLLWSKQIGTTSYDFAVSVATDVDGSVVITGATDGSLFGTNPGTREPFLAKYDASGTLLWSQQIRTQTSWSNSVAIDQIGNVYISGRTCCGLFETFAHLGGAFLFKYDPSGNLLWFRQLDSDSDEGSTSVAVDHAGNAFVTGWTFGSLGDGANDSNDQDVFLAKYDASGARLWTRQFGSQLDESGHDVAVDADGNAFITGGEPGSFGGSSFLTKLDPSGNLLWSRQIGTANDDESTTVTVDAFGDVYISGYTGGNLGAIGAGGRDVFLSKFSASGDLLWIQQIGTAGDERSYSIALDSMGNAYFTGRTDGNLGGPNTGDDDAFLAKFTVIPEPSAIILAALPLTLFTGWTRGVRRDRRQHRGLKRCGFPKTVV